MGLCGSSAPNCTTWWNDEPQVYKADPDIAGIGIMTSFIASSFLTIVGGTLYLLVIEDSTKGQNALDNWMWKKIDSSVRFHVGDVQKTIWRPLLEKVILSRSDQQLLTGIAILTAGLLRHCSISVYHFAMISDLALFSSNSHISSLGVLRGYLHNEPNLRDWRICLMAIMYSLFLACLILGSHKASYDSWPYPAQCLFDDLNGNIVGTPSYWMIANAIVLSYGYLWSALLLFDSTANFIVTWVFEKPVTDMRCAMDALRRKRCTVSSSDSGAFMRCHRAVILANQIALETVSKFYSIIVLTFLGSRWFGLVVDLGFLGLGLYSVISDRNIPLSDVDGNENELTFGQIVPLLLLSSVVLVVKEAYEDRIDEIGTETVVKGKTSFLSSSATKAPSTTDTGQVIETLGGLISEDPAEEDDVPSRRPQRADTENGGRTTSTAFTHRQLRDGTERRSMFVDNG